MNKFTVQPQSANTRLDKFLTIQFPKYSRSYIQKNIRAGNVKVNGKTEEADYKLRKGDKVEAGIAPPERISLAPDSSIHLDIIYEDGDIIVINKPTGLVVHAGVKQTQKTLVNALIAHYPKIKDVGDEPNIRPGIVHRLDKDASGLIVIAKNKAAFQHLKQQFKSRKVEKVYTCLVWGKFKEKRGRINLPIAQNPKNPAKMVAVHQAKDPLRRKAQSALTEFRVVNQFDKTALIEVYLRTGRRHQIRVHFKSIGHPLINDSLYGYRRQQILGSGRLFLHATRLSFVASSGKKLSFTSPLPGELKAILEIVTRNE